MLRNCLYCGRDFDPQRRLHDPHGCFGCTSRFTDLSICQICCAHLPMTRDRRRYIDPNASACRLCGAPRLPAEAETEISAAREPVPS